MRTELQPLAQALGANVRTARQNAGLTLRKVGRGCEVDETFISGIEGGRKLPSLKTIVKIAGVTGVTTEDLVKGLPKWNPATERPGAFIEAEQR
jgi:transcriptional regulator with XRE-family HTH domain